MRHFQMMQLRQAIVYSLSGGQALHLHTIVTPRAPACFKAAVRRGEQIAHLFDMDHERLVLTAHHYGVRVIRVEHKGTQRQHIDICGAPLRRMLADNQDAVVEPGNVART